MRPSKEKNFLEIALKVAERSTCLRTCYGSVIVNYGVIIGTGYNGAARDEPNCIDVGSCRRKGIPSRTRYELCAAVHGETNAITNSLAAFAVRGSRIYIAGFEAEPFHSEGVVIKKKFEECFPCQMCWRQMINAGIKEVCLFGDDGEPGVLGISYFKKVDGV